MIYYRTTRAHVQAGTKEPVQVVHGLDHLALLRTAGDPRLDGARPVQNRVEFAQVLRNIPSCAPISWDRAK